MKKLSFLERGVQSVWDQQILSEVGVLLEKRFQSFLEDETFIIEASQNSSQVQVRMTLSKRDGSWAYPVECIMVDWKQTGKKAVHLVETLVDWLDLYWDCYLKEGRETLLPLSWSEREFEELLFFVRGFPRNLELERAAEELLNEHGTGEYDIDPISQET